MAKRRPGKQDHDSTTTNNNNNTNGSLGRHPKHSGKTKSSASSSLYQWLTPATLLKAAVLVVIVAVGPVIVLKDLAFEGPENRHASSLSSGPSPSRTVKNNGGWRLADADTVARLDSDLCNIDRVSVEDLDSARFERDFRYKRPVIVTFPNGASDWTDPEEWSLEELTRFGTWVLGWVQFPLFGGGGGGGGELLGGCVACLTLTYYMMR